MKYLLFDRYAIATCVQDRTLQSIEFTQGRRFVEHVCGKLNSELFQNVAIKYTKDGVLFVGQKKPSGSKLDHEIFCIDLTTCPILEDTLNPADLLTLLQKSFRLVFKIWNRQPFSSSERYHGTKSILFPFPFPDRRRLVIERSTNILRLEKRGINYPLLAYKYNAEDPKQFEDVVDTRILKKASEDYLAQYIALQHKFYEISRADESGRAMPWRQIISTKQVERDDFIFWSFERQYESLTDSQKSVVDYLEVTSPLRIEGAAGTGKTVSMIMRAYKLLQLYHERGRPFHISFFAHSESTSTRNQELFELYPESATFLDPSSLQSIQFATLLEFCSNFSNIEDTNLIEHDAMEAKNYQLMLISDVVEKAIASNRIKTFWALLSPKMQNLFDFNKTKKNVLYHMLQHEFSIQIKGRTNCTIDDYYEIEPIENGIPHENKRDKELIFSLFNDYQNVLQSLGFFDVDDVTIETLSRLNAPIWRRRRIQEGFDYIFVDEMHLFNINEQSVFHFLTKDLVKKAVPICFALDYSQAIGDRGNVQQDYIEMGFGSVVEEKKLHTIFRNAPPIAEFCISIATAGTLMFGNNFSNPYGEAQSAFTESEETKSFIPELHLYQNDEAMISQLDMHIGEIMKNLQCKASDIAIVSFENSLLSSEGVERLEKHNRNQFSLLDLTKKRDKNKICLASPYAINGLEFQAVILLGADEGRVPQTAGTSDISQHFIQYSAYNLLYLSVSRAKYIVRVLGSKLNGISTCLEHSKQIECLKVVDHTN